MSTNDDQHNEQQHIWKTSSVGWVKCNMDADFNKHLGTTNRGCCYIDCTGRFIMTGVRT